MARIRGVATESATTALADRGLIEEAGRSQFGAVLYRTTPLFLKLFGLDSPEALPDIAQWDPSPEEAAALRDRLLRAGEARRVGQVVSLRCARGHVRLAMIPAYEPAPPLSPDSVITRTRLSRSATLANACWRSVVFCDVGGGCA